MLASGTRTNEISLSFGGDAGIAGGGSGEGDKEGGVAAGDFEASNAVGECAAQPASARRSAINTMGLFCVQMRACATFIATMRRLVLFAQCSL